MIVAAWLLGATLGGTVAQAQHDHAANQGSRPVTLDAGLTGVHHPIQTQNAEAQKFFDQGLTLIYAFNHEEAVRSFEKAAELDAESPMPYWGIALALGPNINQDVDLDREKAAYEAVQRAVKLASRAPENERAYVGALVKRYSNDPKADLKALAVQYRDAMRALAQRYPGDLDAATLYAESLMDLHPWQLWSSTGAPTEGTLEIVAVLESVLARDSQHVGANHYYIHATEASLTPDRALDSAKRLETLVPSAGHLVHMPAHTYMRTGNYAGAVKANAIAADVDRKYIAEAGPNGFYPTMYYNHNLDFLASAAMMTGQFARASQAADELVKNVTPIIADMAMVEPFAAKKMYVLLRFAKWQDVLQLPMPDSKATVTTTLFHFGRGVAQAALGAVADAGREREAYRAARQRVPADAMIGYNPASAIFLVCDAVLDARIAAAGNNLDSAIQAWQKAVAAEDALSYDEPSDWFYPTRESLGAAYFRAKRYEEADRTFREDLERNPDNPRSLFALWQMVGVVGEPDDPVTMLLRRRFREAWTDADAELKFSDF
jgi:tetratricopeptide (TPR) repeat protein